MIPGVSPCAHPDEHYPKSFNECWITNVELSRLSLQHEVPEQAGSHMDMGCQLQPLQMNPRHQAGVWRKPCTPWQETRCSCFSIGSLEFFLGLPWQATAKLHWVFRTEPLVHPAQWNQLLAARTAPKPKGDVHVKRIPGYYSDILK